MKDTPQPREMIGCVRLCVKRRCGSGEFCWDLLPEEAEVHGLVALMEIHASRAKARVNASGEPILLLDQDRGQWDRLLIHRGLAELERAERLGGMRGPYAIQAAIAACHARARTGEETDWARIAVLYGELGEVTPSPVVELNRAVAVGMAMGPAAGLELVDPLASDPAMQNYHLLPSVRGDLLKKLGRTEEARAEFERAASITRNARERNLLLQRRGVAGRHETVYHRGHRGSQGKPRSAAFEREDRSGLEFGGFGEAEFALARAVVRISSTLDSSQLRAMASSLTNR